MADTQEQAVIRMYGADWCADTRLAKRFMEKHGIAYEWIDVDQSDEARAAVKQINHGYVSVPTIVFGDGTTMTEPTWSELAAKFLRSGN